METVEATENQQTTLLSRVKEIQRYLNYRIVGQSALVTRLLIALLADGHLLVEGPPGLAKTTIVKALGKCLKASFQRIQFTPDLLPGDLTGTQIYRPQDGSLSFQSGPVFCNLLLADEINRASPKLQSALLEAMAERQVTVGKTQYELPELFMVMATQNPIEQDGTYPLPEAQLDRFLLYVCVNYSNEYDVEKQILHVNQSLEQQQPPLIDQSVIKDARYALDSITVSPALEEYLLRLVLATRNPSPYKKELAKWLRFGASSRATLALDRCARAHAWLQGRDYVLPEDIQALAKDVLRHRVLLNFEAQASGICSDHFIEELLRCVPVS